MNTYIHGLFSFIRLPIKPLLWLFILMVFTQVIYSCKKAEELPIDKRLYQFDSDIISNLTSYDLLRILIVQNRDSLIYYNKKHEFLDNIRTAFGDSNIYDCNCFIFHHRNRSFNEKSLPTYLYISMNKLINKIGLDKIEKIIYKSDTSLSFVVRRDLSSNFFYGVMDESVHSLTYNTLDNIEKKDRGYILEKDTILSKNWTYQITIRRHYGRW